MLEFTEEEKELQQQLNNVATRLKELAFEIQIGKYKEINVDYKPTLIEIRDKYMLVDYQETGFTLCVEIKY